MTTTSDREPMGIYVHIPFCLRKCPYCGFFSRPPESRTEVNDYVRRIIGEIKAAASEYGVLPDGSGPRRADSIFIGGGTPSLLEPEQVSDIISALRAGFLITPDAEISIEANPGTLEQDRAKLAGFLAAGINRLSIGVQSFDDRVLRTLGRIHNAGEAERTFRAAREAGFDNINIDLMFGIPGQTAGQWDRTLRKATELDPEHISFYSLQLEEGTPFFEDFEAGRLTELTDDLDRAMYHHAIALLRNAGYHHYEISNAAKPGFECRHNLKYWTLTEYLGIGDTAASYIGGTRFTMMDGVKRDVHVNSSFDDMSEYMFTGLRLTRGILYSDFRRRFGMSPEEAFADRWAELDEFFRSGTLERRVTNDGERAVLLITEKGIDISNRIMEVFV